MDYYLSMKQILLAQISNLIHQHNFKEERKSNEAYDCDDEISHDLKHLQTALEEIKSYNDNQYFKSIIKQFECEQILNIQEVKTLKHLIHNTQESEPQYPWIFYKGFKQWYNTVYIDSNGSISNTRRSETLFTGAASEEFTQKLHIAPDIPQNHNDQYIFQLWQTLLGINLLNQYKSHQITAKHIMGKKRFIDITKCTHFATTHYDIVKSSLLRLSIVQNNIFKAKIEDIHIYDSDIFKIAASILWDPSLASNIVNICILKDPTAQIHHNKPKNFEEAFKIQEEKRLSQHTKTASTKMSLPEIPETPTMDTDVSDSFKSIDNNEIVNIVNNSMEDTHTLNTLHVSSSLSNEVPDTESAMQGQLNRPSFNLEEEDADNTQFYDHHGQHESTYSNEFVFQPDIPLVEDESGSRSPLDINMKRIDSIESSSIVTDTEYTEEDDDDEHKTNQIEIENDLNRDTENEMSDDDVYDKDTGAKANSKRTGTMVEYDVPNILSGDTVKSTSITFEEYIQQKEKEIERDTDTPFNIEHINTTMEVPPMTALNLSVSTPQLGRRTDSGYIGNTKVMLHGYYKNATSEQERWKRLKQRIQRHWDEDVTTKMKTFCEENEFGFEDILEDIADTMEDVRNSNIISHLKEELFWNDAKTLRFYRTLRRILISRQSTQIQDGMASAFIASQVHRNGNDTPLRDVPNEAMPLTDVVSINLTGHSGRDIHDKSKEIKSDHDMLPIYIRRTSHELQTEKAWWCIKRSLLQHNWGHNVILEFKKLCAEDDFESIPLIIDDIGCFDNGDSLLMPALAQRLQWDDTRLQKFVADLRIALTDDMQRLARDSRDVKRVEIPTIEFARTDSLSVSGSPLMREGESKEFFPKEIPMFVEQKSKDDGILSPDMPMMFSKDHIFNVVSKDDVSPPPVLTRNSTPATVTGSEQSANSSMNKLIDIGDPDVLCAHWKQMHLKNKNVMYDESCNKCNCAIDDCVVFQRVRFIMEFYMRWILIDQTEHTSNGMKDEEVYHQISIYTFIYKLTHYSYTQLWNDYFHIRQYHAISNPNWNMWIGDNICVAKTCRILSRYHRQRTLYKDNDTRLEMYNLKESNQTYEVITQQLCDIIHCTLYHPIAVHTNNFSKLTMQSSVDTMINNNSDSDIEEQKDDDKKQYEDGMNDDITMTDIELKVVDSKIYHKLRGERIKHHKFLIEIETKCNNETVSIQPAINKTKSNTAFRALPGLSDDHNRNEWNVFLSLNMKQLEQYSKYGELHEELLNNDIATISEEQWNDTWKRVELFKKTWKGKQMVSRRSSSSLQKRIGDPIPTHYVMALMLWCNFDSLQREFRQHCKCIQQNNDSKHDRFEFSRWGFWLNAAIKCYGTNMEEHEQYYCCMRDKIMLNAMWLQFAHPTSITRSYLITQIYSSNGYNRNGVIFVLSKPLQQESTSYINCSWISDYGYEEEECLLFNAPMDIKSADLLSHDDNNMNQYEYYTPYFFTLKWWDIMTDIGSYKYFNNELGDDKEKMLLQLLLNNTNRNRRQQQYNQVHTVTHVIPQYIEALFDHLCARKQLDINLNLLDELLLSSSIKEWFIDKKDGRVDFWKLVSLFPNATKFNIRLQKGLSLDSFICEKFLKTIDRWNMYNKVVELKVNVVMVMSDQHNRNLKEQTKHFLKSFRSKSWMMFFTKAGNKIKFEKNTNFVKKN